MSIEAGNNPPPQGASPTTTPQTWAIVVWALYIGACFTGISGIAGLIIAYIKRDELAGTPFGSHMIYAIRTFWIGIIGFVIAVVLVFVVIGIPLLFAVGIWVLYRSIRGLVCAIDSRPITDPRGWF